jgi:hypothetical protein
VDASGRRVGNRVRLLPAWLLAASRAAKRRRRRPMGSRAFLDWIPLAAFPWPVCGMSLERKVGGTRRERIWLVGWAWLWRLVCELQKRQGRDVHHKRVCVVDLLRHHDAPNVCNRRPGDGDDREGVIPRRWRAGSTRSAIPPRDRGGSLVLGSLSASRKESRC